MKTVWKADELTCRNCGAGPGSILDKTPLCGHMVDGFGGDDPRNTQERLLWCKYCGAIITANCFDDIGTEDWYIPIYTESAMVPSRSNRRCP